MKLSYLVIFLMAMIAIGCSNNSKNENKPIKDDVENSKLTKDEIESPLGNQIIDIDITVAKKIARKFTNIAADRLNSNNLDTIEKCVIFRKNELEAILNGIPNGGYLGVYFGNYTDNPGENVIAQYLGGDNSTGQDFTKYTGKFTVILAKINNSYNVFGTLVNLGGLCPPTCPASGNIHTYLHVD